MGMISQSGGGVPVGAELPFHGGTVPDGFLLMYGQTVNIADYPALFTVLGTQHGGDGVTTFGIPDSRGRATIGKDDMGGAAANRVTVAGSGLDGAALGAVGGGESVTQSTAEMPSHSHLLNISSNNAAGPYYSIYQTTNAARMSSLSAGSGGAHRNMQPSIVANKIIKF